MSEKLYDLVLKLYPSRFREEFGDEALRLMRDRARNENSFRLWLDLLRDLAISLPREHIHALTTPIAAAHGEPFRLLDESSLSPSLLSLGGALTALLFSACALIVEQRTATRFPVLLPVPLLQRLQSANSSAQEKHPKFEVVSIKRHAADSGPVQLGPTPEGFRAIGIPMFGLFQWAFAPPNQLGLLRGDQIEGDPRWLSEELYDVVAKVEQSDLADWQKPQTQQTMLRAMLQTMLAERCKLAVHYGNKETPVYDLVVAKAGPKFQKAETTDTSELRRQHPAGGIMRGSVTMTVPGSTKTQFYAMSMSILANTILSSLADRPVVDKTGLTAYYDLALPSAALRRQPPGTPPADPPIEDDSIFAALETIGLRLEPAKGQVQTLVIDRVERPSGN